MPPTLKTSADEIWKNKVDKTLAELFALTYGTVVAQLCRDLELMEAVNAELAAMGERIGVRLIEEYLAKTGVGRCTSFKETMEQVSKLGFRIFLNVVPRVEQWAPSGKACVLVLDENPLAEFVELGEAERRGGLWYLNVLVGVLKGALQSVQLEVEAEFVKDVLRGDETTEMKLRLVRVLKDEVPVGED